MRAHPTQAEGRRWQIVLAITVAGAMLRLISIRESLWIDELHTAWTVVGVGNEIADRARLGNNSSAYFVIVRMFTDLLGVSEWTLRLPSFLCGCAIIPMTYVLARHWNCSLPAACVASGLVAIDTNNLYFSGEARTYAMVQLVSLIHLLLFSILVVQQHNTWSWIFWVISGITLFHLHCTTALIFGAEIIVYLSLRLLHREPGMHWLYLSIGLLMIGLAMVPALPLVRQIADRRENWALFVSQTKNPLALLWLYPLPAYVVLPVACGFVSWGLKRFRLNSESEEEALAEQSGFLIPAVMATSWILVPLVSAWFLTELDFARLFYRRYVIASSIALAPLTAIIVSKFIGRRRGWSVSLVVLLIGSCLISPVKNLRYGAAALAHSHEDWRTPITTITASDPSIPVILYSGLIEADEWYDSNDAQEQQYCELPLRGIYKTQAERPIIVLPKTRAAVISKPQLRVFEDAAWLLIRGNAEQAERTKVEVLSILGNAWTASQPSRSSRVHLLRLRRDSVAAIAKPSRDAAMRDRVDAEFTAKRTKRAEVTACPNEASLDWQDLPMVSIMPVYVAPASSGSVNGRHSVARRTVLWKNECETASYSATFTSTAEHFGCVVSRSSPFRLTSYSAFAVAARHKIGRGLTFKFSIRRPHDCKM